MSVNIWSIIVNICQYTYVFLQSHWPCAFCRADSGSLTLDTHFRPFFDPNFGSIFDVVFGSKMGHFWNPKCAQMSPNGDPQMCLHNDVSKNQFWVMFCQILDFFNTRKLASRLDAVLIFTFSPDRHFSASKARKVPNLGPKWSSKSDKIPPKHHPRCT